MKYITLLLIATLLIAGTKKKHERPTACDKYLYQVKIDTEKALSVKTAVSRTGYSSRGSFFFAQYKLCTDVNDYDIDDVRKDIAMDIEKMKAKR